MRAHHVHAAGLGRGCRRIRFLATRHRGRSPPPPKAVLDADAVAAIIDRHLAADWEARGIKPAAITPTTPSSVRRVYLDLIGRVPKAPKPASSSTTRSAKSDQAGREASDPPSHAAHFAAVTRSPWLPQTVTNHQFAFVGMQLEVWLRKQYRENTPADVDGPPTADREASDQRTNTQIRFVQGDVSDPEASLGGVLPGQRGQARERRRPPSAGSSSA